MNFKDLFIPETVSILSYVAVFFWILLDGIVSAIFLDMEINESRFDVSCDVKTTSEKDFIQGKCFDQYQKKVYKLGIPLYAFVIVNFLSISLVSLVYSLCIKSTVNRLKGALRDAERRLSNRRRIRRRCLFFAYLSQLAAKFALGIIFIVFLKTDLLYPRHFPADFTCPLERGNDLGKLSTNQTQSTVYECINRGAGKKNFWTNAVAVVNGIVAFVAYVEIVWILLRAKKGRTFMDNRQFYTDHLRSNSDQQQETPPGEIPEVVNIQNVSSSVDSGEAEQEMLLEHSELPREELKLTEAIKKMKEDCLNITEELTDLKLPFGRNPGEGLTPNHLNIDQIYVNVAMHEGRADHVFAKDRSKQLKEYPPDSKNCFYAKPEDVIDKKHKNVLVVGRPGIGKTLLSTMIARMWASGGAFNGNQDDKTNVVVVFLMKFRRFASNLVLSLHEMLANAETVEHLHKAVWEFVIKSPSQVLFIFDGVDEYSAKEDIAREDHTCYKNGLEEKMPVSALFNKLARGQLLRGLNIITTTRPTAVPCIAEVNFDRTVEILGFTSEKIEDYVEKFTQGVRTAKDKIWGHIKSNMNLFSLCYIPVNCFLICSCLVEIISLTDTAHTLPTRMTDIYAMVVKILFFQHSRQSSAQDNPSLKDYMYLPFNKLPNDHKEIFKRLGEIAFEGVKQGRLLFESSEVSGLEDCGLLHRLPDAKSRFNEPPKAQYCFTHLTLQEFFAAKHLAESLNKRELENFVSEHINDGAWQMVLQFVAGLLGSDPETKSSNSDIFIKLLPMSTDEESERYMMYDYLLPMTKTLTYWPASKDKELALNLCKCLYEIDDEKQQAVLQNKIKQIGFNTVDFSWCSLAPVDFAAVSHFLENSSGVLSMNLGDNDLGSLGAKEVQKFLVSTGCQLNSLNLEHNELTDEGAEHLSAALKHSNCKLKYLKVWDNHITNTSVLLSFNLNVFV
ncbi:nucleotide-binding oligomerization domain-containing protein 1-like [Montipora capricornis]|uniref:nucleotide-binding oligomerization domain-containing protein 1-like n=1 Tax=Montipora capricornis TaxID=246305 RepID=UPI0035F1F9B8